jgi:hypothetical protein
MRIPVRLPSGTPRRHSSPQHPRWMRRVTGSCCRAWPASTSPCRPPARPSWCAQRLGPCHPRDATAGRRPGAHRPDRAAFRVRFLRLMIAHYEGAVSMCQEAGVTPSIRACACWPPRSSTPGGTTPAAALHAGPPSLTDLKLPEIFPGPRRATPARDTATRAGSGHRRSRRGPKIRQDRRRADHIDHAKHTTESGRPAPSRVNLVPN